MIQNIFKKKRKKIYLYGYLTHIQSDRNTEKKNDSGM